MTSDETDLSQNKPSRLWGQFRISTLLSWTLMIFVILVNFGVSETLNSEGMPFQEVVLAAFIVGVFCLPACTCIPFLIDRLLDRNSAPEFSLFWRLWLSAFLGVYSIGMLVLATCAFPPEWKGSKGEHWSFYLLDGWAGATLWPIYIFAVGCFVFAVWNPKEILESPRYFIATFLLTIISCWYAFACWFLNFCLGSKNALWIVPGSVGVCYLIVCCLVLKHRKWNYQQIIDRPKELIYWALGLAVLIAMKVPLAMRFYDDLPDEPPPICFVVTAASRGHQSIVGTWFDEVQNRKVNQQLLDFWAFESWLKRTVPRSHRLLRGVYNVVGPMVARTIVFRWQADLVYCLLKPIEFLLNFCKFSEAKKRV